MITQNDSPVLVRSAEYGVSDVRRSAKAALTFCHGCQAIDFARVLDDRYITNAAYLPPETSQPPLIVGFHHITRLFWSVPFVYRTLQD